MVGRIKSGKILEIGQGVRPCEATLYQKVEIFAILGAVFPSREPITVRFRVAKWTHMPLGRAKFHVNRRCNETPLQGKNVDFLPLSKFNTGSLLLCGIVPVKSARKRHKHCA